MYRLVYFRDCINIDILPCTCTVLSYILEYNYIVQIAKSRTSPALAQVECLLVFYTLKAHKTYTSFLLFVQYRYIPICKAKQYILKSPTVGKDF